MIRRRLLSIVGGLGLITGLLSSGVVARAATPMSDADFQAMVSHYVTLSSNGGTFCYPQPSSTPGTCPPVNQVSTDRNNVAVCVEYSSTNPASQECDINQTSTSGNNIAIIIQLVRQRGAAAESGNQSGFINQDSGTGSNFAATVQVYSQRNGNAAGAPNQRDDQFSSTNQTSTSGGHNFKLLKQSSQQDGQSALGGTQNSSEAGEINQHSTGLSVALAFQNQHQGLTGGGAQHQTIDPRCCSEQKTNDDNFFEIAQAADQHGDGVAVQNSSTIGTCDSSGDCGIDQTASSNTGFHHNHLTCHGTLCATGIVCTTTTCTPCTPGSEGCFVPGFAPVASLTGHGLVAVRGSVVVSGQTVARYGGVTRSASSAALLT